MLALASMPESRLRKLECAGYFVGGSWYTARQCMSVIGSLASGKQDLFG